MSQLDKKIAAVQMDVAFGDIHHNLANVVSKLPELRSLEIDLAVFPECVLTGYCYESREEALPHARSVSDPLFAKLAEQCSNSSLSIIVGFLERDGDRMFNSQALINASGVLATYRKIHLPTLGVDQFVDRGDRDFAVCNAGEIRVGMAICYDSSFPETARVLGLGGADVIALSTNWPVAAKRTAEIVPAARSMENHLYFVAANRIGNERSFDFCGMSCITGPDGVVLASTNSDDEIILTAEINLAVARNKRIVRTTGKHSIDRFADRVPERYGPICDID